MKDGPKNRLRSQDIHKIVDVFNKQAEVERFSRMVPRSEIADPKNDFNLNIPRYIDVSDPEDLQDLQAHLSGGIPERDIDALGDFWDAFPKLRRDLFRSNRPGYLDLAVDVADIQQTILESSEFKAFADKASKIVGGWFETHRPKLAAVTADTKPLDLITEIGDDLLDRFRLTPLLDEYDAYEQLMTYWHGSMHDDLFLVMQEGWVDAAKPRLAIQDKDRKLSEEPDLTIGSGKTAQKYKMDLLPPRLIVARYFADERRRIDKLNTEAESAAGAVEEHVGEHGDDEGLLSNAVNDKGKLTQAAAKEALKEAKAVDDQETIECARAAIELLQAEAAAKKAGKDAQTELDHATLEKYGDLTQGDAQALVLDDKWAASIRRQVVDEVTALTLGLVARIQQLGERYAETVGDLDADLEELEARVTGHLATIGVEA